MISLIFSFSSFCLISLIPHFSHLSLSFYIFISFPHFSFSLVSIPLVFDRLRPLEVPLTSHSSAIFILHAHLASRLFATLSLLHFRWNVVCSPRFISFSSSFFIHVFLVVLHLCIFSVTHFVTSCILFIIFCFIFISRASGRYEHLPLHSHFRLHLEFSRFHFPLICIHSLILHSFSF